MQGIKEEKTPVQTDDIRTYTYQTYLPASPMSTQHLINVKLSDFCRNKCFETKWTMQIVVKAARRRGDYYLGRMLHWMYELLIKTPTTRNASNSPDFLTPNCDTGAVRLEAWSLNTFNNHISTLWILCSIRSSALTILGFRGNEKRRNLLIVVYVWCLALTTIGPGIALRTLSLDLKHQKSRPEAK